MNSIKFVTLNVQGSIGLLNSLLAGAALAICKSGRTRVNRLFVCSTRLCGCMPLTMQHRVYLELQVLSVNIDGLYHTVAVVVSQTARFVGGSCFRLARWWNSSCKISGTLVE